MATIPKTGIVNGQTADASQVTNIIDALDGTTNNEINILGTLSLSNISDVSASIADISSSIAAIEVSGLDQQVQFNNGGAFGASSNFTFDNTTNTLSVSKFDSSNITTTNINTNSATTTNIGTGAGSIITIGDTTSGNININNGATLNLGANSSTVNLGLSATAVNIGSNSARLILNSTGILNTDRAYFYGNSGTNALNIGYSNSSVDSANSRAYFTVSNATSQLGLKSTTNGSGFVRLTAYETYGELEVQNPTGTSFFINNNNSLSNFQFGGGGNNGRVVVYTSNASLPANEKPGAQGGAYGGLYVAKNLELGGAYAWKSSGTTWSVSSDERVKENIITASLETCYNSIKNISLKRFNYTEDFSSSPLYDVNQLGWVAQEVALELPKAISSGSFTTWTTYTGSKTITGSDGSIVEPGDRVQDTSLGSQTIENFLTLDSDQIIKVMFGAIQHLQTKVEALENQ